MNARRKSRLTLHLLLIISVALVITGVVILAKTFTQYNELSLDRQDQHLAELAQATDENMAMMLTNLQEDLRYVLSRRGFINAEAVWMESGDTADLLFRMQESLVAQHPLVHALLAIRDGQIMLSSSSDSDYYFPDSSSETIRPCFSGDGSMYLAMIDQTQHAQYAALISVADWYAALSRFHAEDNTHLMLLGSQEKLLLHTWMGEMYVSAVEDLNESNCDLQAVRLMMQSRTSGKSLTASYHITYPGSDFIHDMRMSVIPLTECTNGYFLLGITTDYDEIVQPMHAALVRLVISGSMLVVGLMTLAILAFLLMRQGRHRDQELERLTKLNDETQRLLEKTQALAHHQRLETIGTLTASIAHEFNNLLTPIMGYAILTLEALPTENEDLADNITEIYEASRKAKEIISRLNALSRRNAEESYRPLYLADIVRRALDVATPAQPAHVDTHVIVCDEACIVSGSETQLSQLMLNLILNAYHAMEHSGGTLTLRVGTVDGEARLQVEDTGCGIAPESIQHIFEPFYTTKDPGRGTGLGLAIVQQVTDAHHGRITVRSQPGQGTGFTLYFPLIQQQDSANS